MSEHHLCSLNLQVATALDILKDRRIIHGDLKEDNIMLVDCEEKPIAAKLIDFGLAFQTHKATRGLLCQPDMYRWATQRQESWLDRFVRYFCHLLKCDTVPHSVLYVCLLFRAPEVHLGLPFSEAIDMWSLGIVMGSMMLSYSINQGGSRYDKVSHLFQLLIFFFISLKLNESSSNEEK